MNSFPVLKMHILGLPGLKISLREKIEEICILILKEQCLVFMYFSPLHFLTSVPRVGWLDYVAIIKTEKFPFFRCNFHRQSYWNWHRNFHSWCLFLIRLGDVIAGISDEDANKTPLCVIRSKFEHRNKQNRCHDVFCFKRMKRKGGVLRNITGCRVADNGKISMTW